MLEETASRRDLVRDMGEFSFIEQLILIARRETSESGGAAAQSARMPVIVDVHSLMPRKMVNGDSFSKYKKPAIQSRQGESEGLRKKAEDYLLR